VSSVRFSESLVGRWVIVKAVLIAALALNMVVVAAVPGAKNVIRALRPLFLLERLRNVRRIASTIVQVGN
jgi:hypothetical protein